MTNAMTQQELWQAVQDHGGIRAAGRKLGIPESTIRTRLKGYEPELPENAYVPTAEELPRTHVEEGDVDTWDYWTEHKRKPKGTVQRYILTSAQNNCDVHEQFLANLKALADEADAELMVSFTLYDRQGYRGLTAKGETRIGKHEIWWDKRLKDYIVNDRCRLHRRLAFCGELDVLATAKRPLSGLESYCGRSSIIVPHNRFQFHCVESRKHQMPKEMFTTGSVTRKKFIQRKAGQIAQFHHVLGALLIEVTADGYWYVHHLNAEDDGTFYWLDKIVEQGIVKDHLERLPAVVLGDIHHEKLEADQSQQVYDILGTFEPENVLVHDLIDFKSRNHHNRDDPLFRVSMLGMPNVRREIENAGEFLDTLVENAPNANIVVAASNHDAAFTRWIKDTDWRDDPLNADWYLETALELVRARKKGVSLNPLEWAIMSRLGSHRQDDFHNHVVFLALDQPYEIEGVECGIHGHVGPSGTRGTPRGYAKLGFKTFTGHTHSPSIVDGCYTVGVAGSLDMGYNIGPSKWMHAHGLIYPNGKRAFLFIKNGKWRA